MRRDGPATEAGRGEVTRLLGAWQEGDREAGDRLVPLVYRELRRRAARCMATERPGHTLEPTALVHEAYLRLAGGHQPAWRDRRHFFAVSARIMRRVLVDHARARCTVKRGGAAVRVPLDDATRGAGGGSPREAAEPPAGRPDLLADLLTLDQSLDRLAAIDPRKARVIELRYFGGLTVDEVAEVLGVSAPTVALDSRMARAWLLARHRAHTGPGSDRASDRMPLRAPGRADSTRTGTNPEERPRGVAG